MSKLFCPTLTGRRRAPPVLDALVFDVAARFEAADLVGAGAERHVEGRFVERTRRVIGAREDRQCGDEQRHVARALRARSAPPRSRRPPPRRRRSRAGSWWMIGMALLLEGVEREGDVVRGEPGCRRGSAPAAACRNGRSRPSAEMRTARAARPYIASGSSAARAIRLAKVSSMPWAASPRRM